jgi:hypothetical protein
VRELVKGRVLESAMLTAREVSATSCARATGAEGIQVVGSKFVIYRKNDKPKEEKKKAREAGPGEGQKDQPRLGGRPREKAPRAGREAEAQAVFPRRGGQGRDRKRKQQREF